MVMITNDKFCLPCPGRLTLSWWRYPLRRREQGQAQRDTVPDTEGDRGDAHAAPMASPPPDTTYCGRSAPVGSGLPADPELEPGGRPAGGAAPGHPLATAAGDKP